MQIGAPIRIAPGGWRAVRVVDMPVAIEQIHIMSTMMTSGSECFAVLGRYELGEGMT